MFVLELRVLPVLWRSPEGSGVPMDFADGLPHLPAFASTTKTTKRVTRTCAETTLQLTTARFNTSLTPATLDVNGFSNYHVGERETASEL